MLKIWKAIASVFFQSKRHPPSLQSFDFRTGEGGVAGCEMWGGHETIAASDSTADFGTLKSASASSPASDRDGDEIDINIRSRFDLGLS
ncbi:hypothetical protein [Lyngbya sp. CCY1209]|uniref:hypothetical protein n=1 Tax=Lyngbya sp. CCY1209 TaxID=2886103 RepID=UPI002D209006|nr:hypothetical protein [Lyngbya sp. CCY1209]MEB3885738.1 hypothetical protein [Lyngbya sp. CCY1209]